MYLAGGSRLYANSGNASRKPDAFPSDYNNNPFRGGNGGGGATRAANGRFQSSAGGAGGGGDGGNANNVAYAGTPNTGGGGGGGIYWYNKLNYTMGARGGSGIIIIRWGY